MKIAILAVLFAVLAITSCAGVPVSEEQQILKLESDWARALETRDRQLLEQIVAKDFTFIEPDGSIRTRDEYLADRSSDIADIESIELSEMKVDVYGNSALASGVGTFTERRAGKRYRFSLRWKELWLKQDGRWQVLAGQATPINPEWDRSFVLKE